MITIKHFSLNFLVSALLSVSQTSQAFAAPLRYSPGDENSPSSLRTAMPLSQIGKLSVPGGIAVIEGNAIEIQAVPEGLFDPRQVLSGVLVSTVGVPSRAPQAIKGIVYFFAGSWLNYLSLPPKFELVQKIDGTMITGVIIGGDEKSLSIRLTDGSNSTIEFSQIADIESPRAYSILLPFVPGVDGPSPMIQGDAKSIRLQPNTGGQRILALRRTAAPLLGDEHGISRAQIKSYLAIDFFATIAPMIAAPLVLQRANTLSASRLVYQYNTINALGAK